MAYNELVKNFNRIRDYMREFYIYGLRAVMNIPKRARALMTMNAAVWKVGWGII